jgi:hypothetical protein
MDDDDVLAITLGFIVPITTSGLYKPRGILRVWGREMCVTKVWGVLGVFGGLNPGFTHFGGFGGYLGFGSFSPTYKT